MIPHYFHLRDPLVVNTTYCAFKSSILLFYLNSSIRINKFMISCKLTLTFADLGCLWQWNPQPPLWPGVEEPGLLGHRRPHADHPHQRQRRGRTSPLFLCAGLTFLFLLLAIIESFCDFIPHQEMAMRKVTRTLFHDDEDDDMVNCSLTENIMHQERHNSDLRCDCTVSSRAAVLTNSPCHVSPPAGSSQHKRCRQWVQSEEPHGDLRLVRADVGPRLRCLQQRGSTWRPRGTFLFHGNQWTQTGSEQQHLDSTRQNSIVIILGDKILLFMILLPIKIVYKVTGSFF